MRINPNAKKPAKTGIDVKGKSTINVYLGAAGKTADLGKYDKNHNDIVDLSENALLLDGYEASYFASKEDVEVCTEQSIIDLFND